MKPVIIAAMGHSVPNRQLTSEQIERDLGLSSGWIERRTGIATRRVVEPHQATSNLAIAAGRRAIDRWQAISASNHHVSDIGGLILATSTPDHLLPPTAPMVAHELGLNRVLAFDMAVACSGFVYGLQVAHGLVWQTQKPILLIAANVLSKRVSPNDVNTQALFADAAGAAILMPAEEGSNRGLHAYSLESDGEGWSSLQIPAGGSRQPFSAEVAARGEHFMLIKDGQQAYRYAVESMARCGTEALTKAKLTIEDVKFWIPHQANERVIREVQKRLGFSDEQTVSVIRDIGNSSAATIPVACSMIDEQGKLQPGDTVLFTAAGAGLVAGAAILRW